ncbi:hypothetical protein JM93_00589 [Roseibium hamelinense]|uniref:Uncharacterized protein n=1 Tax=Roseibium hamelinense TaxID=150831 RepID=A0A562TJ85_9HYPH|nr:phosphopantetheine adenylyltransferase [Roseibium hamelinense]MTI45781.1 phosphopantetheine adenylyltransferase [Roseibium hamelinense]TWI93036.1 hypothetical protein JM93_00589 [Roseibium hamelinense]
MSFDRSHHDAKVQRQATDAFGSASATTHPAGFLQVAVILASAFLMSLMVIFATLQPASSMSASNAGVAETQGNIATKSAMAASIPARNLCEGQAWGAWSTDCAAALSGAQNVRHVQFVTVEQATPTVNETILSRFPASEL